MYSKTVIKFKIFKLKRPVHHQDIKEGRKILHFEAKLIIDKLFKIHVFIHSMVFISINIIMRLLLD